MTMSKAATYGAGEFKAKCLELMDSVARSGSSITITKRGVPVAKLVPAQAPPGAPIFGCMRGTFEEVGDIVAPLEGDWSARDDRATLVAPKAQRGRAGRSAR